MGSPATWAYAHQAGLADGLSTAFMIMGQTQIKDLCVKDPTIGALILVRDESAGQVTCQGRAFGNWLGGIPRVLCRCT